MKLRDLSGKWKLCPVTRFTEDSEDLSDWLEMDVPSHWQNHENLENYAGKVIYKKSFALKKKKGAQYKLVLPGIFYWSAVYLNGRRLGDHEGYFNPQQYDVTADLKSKNELMVWVDCPDEKTKNNKRMITGVFSHWDCLDPKSNPGGIWLAPEIHEGQGGFVRQALIHTHSISKDSAKMVMRATMSTEKAEDAKVIVTYKPANFKGPSQTFEHDARLSDGEKEFTFVQHLKDPELWWTHDLGAANLYDVEIALTTEKGVLIDLYQTTVGVRTIDVRNWIFYLNGKRLYIKGNNYAPSDTRLAAVTLENCETDIRLAGQCHMNLLRVHAHVDHPMFYDVADREGILLWQDFPLQWSYKKEILPVAEKQMAEMVRLLYNHPSVGIWCCHNEPIYLVDTKDEDFINISKSLASIFVYSWNRDVMDKQLKKTAEDVDPSRFVNLCSGEPTALKKGGDTHFYFGWYRVQGPKRLFDKIVKYTPSNGRFVTEFGAQSLPNLESCHKFMDPDIDKIDWAHLQERHSLQIDLLDHWVGLKRKSLEELVNASQEYQSRINQYYIDRLRLLKYNPGGGVVPFMFNDPNPAIQWSVVDYWRVPKSSYYRLQQAFAPQYVFVIYNKDEYRTGELIKVAIHAVNDAQRAFENVNVNYILTAPDGSILSQHDFSCYLGVDCMAVHVARVEEQISKPGTYSIQLKMIHPEFTVENDYPLVVI